MRHIAFGLWAALCTWTVLQVTVVTFVTVWPGAGSDVVTLGGLHALVLGGAAYLVGQSLPRETLRRETPESDPLGRLGRWQGVLGLDNPRSYALGLGALAGVLAKVPADALRGVIELRYPTDEVELVQQWNLLRHDTWWQAAMLFVVIGFTGPLFEEVFYRGVLFRRFERGMGSVGGWLATSVIFAVSHPSVRDWPSLLLVGLVLGDLRRVNGTVWASLGAHIAFNCSTLLAVVTGAQTPSAEVTFDWGLVSAAAGLLALLLILGRRLL